MKEESTLEYCQIFNVTEEQKKSKDDFLTLPDVAQVGGLIVPSPSRSSKITEINKKMILVKFIMKKEMSQNFGIFSWRKTALTLLVRLF